MILPVGTRVGPYEIVALIGAGGMGEVYRARDLKLLRDVAIKVLPSAVSNDRGRLARFSREAQLLASFNHRNVAAIYGVEDEGDIHALVMELIEGPTLADRIDEGPIPLADAMLIAKQIAEALEAAHEQGIVHRDLKPANVKLRPDGETKVLDFGLAKVLDAQSPWPVGNQRSGGTTEVPLSAAGIIVGTAPYMSPEQARGLAVDRRTDIWAFGVVLWEMLTARQLFAGPTLSDTIALVLHVEPDWTTLPATTPAPIRRLLERSLQRDRKLRLDSATVARLEIEEALRGDDVVVPARPGWSRFLPWTIAGTLALAVLFLFLRAGPPSNDGDTVPVRLSTEIGADITLRQDLGAAAVLSPDGHTLVFATEATTGSSMLYVRRLDQLVATPLRGTENAANPFFSPDGQWIAFFADDALKRISVAGGTAVTVAEVAGAGRGGSWGEDGSIVFSRAPGLQRVPSSGGVAKPVTSLRAGELSHRWPYMLPGDRGVLYTSNVNENWDDARVMVQPLPEGEPRVVQPGFYGRYVTSGHLLYVKAGTIYAAPFDLGRLEVTGPSVAAVEGVAADTTTGGAQFATSQSGILALMHGQGFSAARAVVWMDRGGNSQTLRSAPADWSNPQVSPDGRQLALDISDGKQTDVWVHDLPSGKLSRLTFASADDSKPVWTPDGQRIVFTSKRDGPANLYWQRADGTGNAERLTNSPNPQNAASWHPNSKVLAFTEVRPETGSDVMMLPVERDSASGWRIGAPRVFAGGAANESEGMFSPDGRWVAYHGNEMGRAEIFVRSFDGDGKWQVSSEGGRDATWSRARPELLFFGVAGNRIMVAPYSVSGVSFRAAAPRAWSNTVVGRSARGVRTFDAHVDGERVVVVPAERQKPDHITLVFNFFDYLVQQAPVAR